MSEKDSDTEKLCNVKNKDEIKTLRRKLIKHCVFGNLPHFRDISQPTLVPLSSSENSSTRLTDEDFSTTEIFGAAELPSSTSAENYDSSSSSSSAPEIKCKKKAKA